MFDTSAVECKGTRQFARGNRQQDCPQVCRKHQHPIVCMTCLGVEVAGNGNNLTRFPSALHHVAGVQEKNTTAAMNTAVSIVEPVNGGVVSIVAAQCHEDVVVLGHLDVGQSCTVRRLFHRRVKGVLIPRGLGGETVRLAYASVVISNHPASAHQIRTRSESSASPDQSNVR